MLLSLIALSILSDINECETLSPCNGTCTNLPGGYTCSCPEGTEGDPWKDGCYAIHKQKKSLPLDIGLGEQHDPLNFLKNSAEDAPAVILVIGFVMNNWIAYVTSAEEKHNFLKPV